MKKFKLILTLLIVSGLQMGCETTYFCDCDSVDSVRIWITPDFSATESPKGEFVTVRKYIENDSTKVEATK